MKFLLEFNEFSEDDSFELSQEIKNDIKEVLIDYLESNVEEKLPEIKEGRVYPNFALNRLYTHQSQNGIYRGSKKLMNNAIFVDKQNYPIQLEHLSQMIKKIDQNLVCFSAHDASILICKKRILDMFNSYQKLPNALENIVAEIVDGYGRWQKWKTAFIIDFEPVKMPWRFHLCYRSECSFTIQKDYPGALGNAYHPKLEIKFYIPDISDWEFFDDITFDLYFEIQKPKRSTGGTSTKNLQYNSDPVLEEIKSRLEDSNDVFMYQINSSQDYIENELSDWIESEILIHFENDFSKKFDRLKQILKNINEIELDYDEDFDVGSTFEVLAKYKSFEMILNFQYDFETDKIKIFDEFDKLLDECPLEDLQESLFLIMTENR